MSPVTGLARLAGRSLPSVHMGNFSPVRELIFQPGYCSAQLLRRTRRVLSSFIPVTGLECSYGKMYSPVTEISVAKTEISVNGLARLLIWTHRNFYKVKCSEARSRKPSQPGWQGSYEEALKVTDVSFCCGCHFVATPFSSEVTGLVTKRQRQFR